MLALLHDTRFDIYISNWHFIGVSNPIKLQFYCVKTLVDDNPDMSIINVGTNLIGKEDPFKIAKDIMHVLKTC